MSDKDKSPLLEARHEAKPQAKPTEAKAGNIYEPFRNQIQVVVRATVMKTRETSVSYNWSVGRVISACATECKLDPSKTPSEFKLIVKYELDKFRDQIAMADKYELVRSRQDYVLADGQMKDRLTNVSMAFVDWETQAREARALYSRLAVKLSDASLSAEKRFAIRKKINSKILPCIDHAEAQLERIKDLQAGVAVEYKALDEPAKE